MKKMLIVVWMVGVGLFGLELGERLPYIELAKDEGGYLDGRTWSAKEMDAKTNIIFYVDPDLKDLNDDFAKKLHKLKLSSKELKVFVIVNMKASWIPNVIIDTVLEAKQKKFPKARYLKDNAALLVKRWNLKDDAYDIVAIDAEHRVLFSHSGVMTASLSDKLIKEIVYRE